MDSITITDAMVNLEYAAKYEYLSIGLFTIYIEVMVFHNGLLYSDLVSLRKSARSEELEMLVIDPVEEKDHTYSIKHLFTFLVGD